MPHQIIFQWPEGPELIITKYTAAGVLFGLISGGVLGTVVDIKFVHPKNPTCFRYGPYMVPAFFAWIFICGYLGHILVYLAGVLPASCEASMTVEGINGEPCSYKRLREWIPRLIRGEAGFDELEHLWVTSAFIAVPCIIVVFLLWLAVYQGKIERGTGWPEDEDEEGGSEDLISV